MNLVPCSRTGFVVASVLVLVCSIASFADDSESPHQLSLADLAAYRAALSGKATGENAKTSDPPVRVGFQGPLESPRRISRPPGDHPGTRRTDLPPGTDWQLPRPG